MVELWEDFEAKASKGPIIFKQLPSTGQIFLLEWIYRHQVGIGNGEAEEK